ncbi:hypothetical protein IJ182_04270 [bacterium]|nr:hypothetical protein [bacterium]
MLAKIVNAMMKLNAIVQKNNATAVVKKMKNVHVTAAKIVPAKIANVVRKKF